MSLLEVVFATVLMAIVAATVFGTLAFVTNVQIRDRQRLAAAEVANRLILQYLDDPSSMPDGSRPVEYGPIDAPLRFRWELAEDQITLLEARPEARDQSRSPLSLDRLRQVTVRVWLAEESGGTRHADPHTPGFILTRLLDPVHIRNPDSFMRLMQDQSGEGFRLFIESIMGHSPPRSATRGDALFGRRSAQRAPSRELPPGVLTPLEALYQGGLGGMHQPSTGVRQPPGRGGRRR